MVNVLVSANTDKSVGAGTVGCWSGGFDAAFNQEEIAEVVVASSDDKIGEFGILGCGGNHPH